MGKIILRTFGQTCEITDTILSARLDEMQEKDIKYLLETGSHPEYFSRYLKVFLKSPRIDHADLVSHAWHCIVRNILPRPKLYYELSSWIPSIRYLIEQGVDIHQPLNACYKSTYMMILSATNHPLEAEHKARSWLEVLKACGVDLSGYVKVETTLLEKFGVRQYPCARTRQLIHLDFEGLPIPCWRWKMVTESSIDEVLSEFHHLGSDLLEFRLYTLNPSGPLDFKHWSIENHYDSWGKKCFPFLLAPVDCIRGPDDHRLNKVWCRETYNRAVEIRNKRFARRHAKKWRKAHPGEKPPSRKMPGTWVD